MLRVGGYQREQPLDTLGRARAGVPEPASRRSRAVHARAREARTAGDVDEAAVREELRRVRAELAGTPVADLVANHAIGLWQLAVLHLTPDEDAPIRLDEAGLAIDAMAALVEQLGDRLGESAEPLRDALAQLRIAFVQISEGSGTAPDGRLTRP